MSIILSNLNNLYFFCKVLRARRLYPQSQPSLRTIQLKFKYNSLISLITIMLALLKYLALLNLMFYRCDFHKRQIFIAEFFEFCYEELGKFLQLSAEIGRENKSECLLIDDDIAGVLFFVTRSVTLKEIHYVLMLQLLTVFLSKRIQVQGLYMFVKKFNYYHGL